MLINRAVDTYRAGGAVGVLKAIARRVHHRQTKSFLLVQREVAGRTGLEIGGPSEIFARGGLLPVYPVAGRIDNRTFATRTHWEGAVTAGTTFVSDPSRAAGEQTIGEGADLSDLPTGRYDFVLSSHMLEHTANPLGALREWRRVLAPGGRLLLVVPHRDGTFDRRRPITTLAHLIADDAAHRGEDDLTHVDEVVALHEQRGPGTGAAFRAHLQQNATHRTMHHHVFDTRLVLAALTQVGFAPLAVEPTLPCNIVVWAGARDGEGAGLDAAAALAASPFRTDRRH